jgi:hypothetical protein
MGRRRTINQGQMNALLIVLLVCTFALGWSWNNKPARQDAESRVPETSTKKDSEA